MASVRIVGEAISLQGAYMALTYSIPIHIVLTADNGLRLNRGIFMQQCMSAMQ